jgi:hypothetical protein
MSDSHSNREVLYNTSARRTAGGRWSASRSSDARRRSWPFSFEHGDLLSKSQNFEGVSLRLRTNTRMPTMNERMNSSTIQFVAFRDVASSGGRSEIASC